MMTLVPVSGRGYGGGAFTAEDKWLMMPFHERNVHF